MGTPKWTAAACTGKQGISQAAVADAASPGYKSVQILVSASQRLKVRMGVVSCDVFATHPECKSRDTGTETSL